VARDMSRPRMLHNRAGSVSARSFVRQSVITFLPAFKRQEEIVHRLMNIVMYDAEERMGDVLAENQKNPWWLFHMAYLANS
jgi:hypothetical protein